MFNPAIFENSAPAGVGVLEIVDRKKVGRLKGFVPLKKTIAGGLVAGPVANLTVTHIYGYRREDCDRTLEALYRFPLPGDAAVTGVVVSFGDVEIRAELKERQEAEEDYAQAKEQGRQAALVTRESADVFTLLVAGIAPDEDITIETSFVLLAKTEGAGWSLRLPLTTAPRFVREDEADTRSAKGQPLATLRDPGHTFSLDLLVADAALIQSATHALAISDEDDRTRIRLRAGAVVPDRDFVLSWLPPMEEERPTLQVHTHDDRVSNSLYFLAMASPPAASVPSSQSSALKREVILLVDHSGSMEGAKWEAADWAVKKFLLGLNEKDAFALCLFHDSTRWFRQAPAKAGTDMVEKAIEFLGRHSDSGGTELGVAMEQALDMTKTAGDFVRHVLVITDAQVSDEARILQMAEQESQAENRRRISILCIDAAPNSHLAQELAEKGGGLARFLTSSPEEGDITSALDEILEDWAQPLLADLELRVNRPDVQFGGQRPVASVQSGWSGADLGDLPSGRTLWVTGRLSRTEQADIEFQLTSRGESIANTVIKPGRSEGNGAGIKSLFGSRTVSALEQLLNGWYDGQELAECLRLLGYNPNVVLNPEPERKKKFYRENVAADSRETLRRLLVKESLDFGIACAETAFVAVRKEQGRIVQGTVPVANALPKDWSQDFVTGALPPQPLAARPRARSAEPDEDLLAPPVHSRPSPRKKQGIFGGLFRPFLPRGRAKSDVVAEEPGEFRPEALFAGVPVFQGKTSVLFDSGAKGSSKRIPEYTTLSRISVHFPGGGSAAGSVGSGLVLLIYVGDLTAPRARVRLADLIKMGGERPLNIRREAGQPVLIVLEDSTGVWATGSPEIEVTLGW